MCGRKGVMYGRGRATSRRERIVDSFGERVVEIENFFPDFPDGALFSAPEDQYEEI